MNVIIFCALLVFISILLSGVDTVLNILRRALRAHKFRSWRY